MSSSSTFSPNLQQQQSSQHRSKKNQYHSQNLLSSITNNQSQPQKHPENQKTFNLNNPNMIKGGLIGMVVSALISWNTGKYTRLGTFRKKWSFIRKFIMAKPKPTIPTLLTFYHQPNIDTVVKNFMCYSGQAGIGKSTHFMNLAYMQSKIRPSLYISFKASGKDATFYQDIAQQVGYGDNCPHILSQIIMASKIISNINKNPKKLWFHICITNLIILGAFYGIKISNFQLTYGLVLFSALGIAYITYLHFISPLILQSLRRTCPVIIFDDLNKIQQMNIFPQISRYLQLLQNNQSNIILISPDQDTWCKLRKQPGMKDRLRVRQIYYDHLYTEQMLLNYIKDDLQFEYFMKFVRANRKLYTKDIVVHLIKQLIGKRQVNLRRFTSLLVLNDQEQSQRLIKVLTQHYEGKIATTQTVQNFTTILYESETKTMLANLKNIKRQLKIKQQQFLQDLKTLLKKGKLPSDNLLAAHLKSYSIVRDLQSQYVFNGRFMFTVLNMAIQQYQRDLKQFKTLNEQQPTILKQTSSIPKADQQLPLSTPNPPTQASPSKQQAIKNWNNTNISVITSTTNQKNTQLNNNQKLKLNNSIINKK